MRNRRFVFQKPEGEGGGGGGSAAPAAAPATAPASGPAAAPPPGAAAPAPAAPAAGPAAAPAASAPAASPPAPAAAPAGAPAAAPAAGYWPDNWRETVSKDDGKRLAQLQRYASPQVALEALFAAQERIRSGELKPVLGKNPSADELKEWRAANGIPEDPTKYDLGKDLQIAEQDKPLFDILFKAAHDSNQTPEQVKATAKTFYAIKQQAEEHQATEDKRMETEAQDSLRAEWGAEYRRNMNLITGLLDGSGDQQLKDSFLRGRLADGTPIGSSPAALRMLLGLALLQNPTGVVVPGGDANREQGLRDELEKLQKVPAGKKTEAQSQRQRDLIDAAVKGGFMDANGNWKK